MLLTTFGHDFWILGVLGKPAETERQKSLVGFLKSVDFFYKDTRDSNFTFEERSIFNMCGRGFVF